MSNKADISDTERLLTRLYQAAAEIGHQREAASDSGSLAEAAMLSALWNDCQLAIKKVHASEEGDKHEEAEEFLGLIYSANE